jgi:hypothetical protein
MIVLTPWKDVFIRFSERNNRRDYSPDNVFLQGGLFVVFSARSEPLQESADFHGGGKSQNSSFTTHIRFFCQTQPPFVNLSTTIFSDLNSIER